MPRFQLKKSASVTLFWEIDVSGAVLKTRFGRVGAESDANETERELPTPFAADKELKRLVGTKRAEGYEEIEPEAAAARAARNEALEAKILAAPEDDAAWRVYSDWLQGQGDPRGELAAIQAELAGKPAVDRQKELEDAEAKLIARHRDLLLGGDLSDLLDETLLIEWRHGFPDRAVLVADETTYERLDELAKGLLAHPSFFALRALTFRTGNDGSYDPSLGRMLSRASFPPTLRELGFGGRRNEEGERVPDAGGVGDVGDLDRLWARVPQLESLRVDCDHASLGKMSLPKLETLSIGMPLGVGAIRDLVASSLPSLRSLHLGSLVVRASELAPLLELPALESLSVARYAYADELAALIVRSSLARRLRQLSLRRGELTDAGADALVAAQNKLGKLEQLDLIGCRLTVAPIDKLKGLCRETKLKGQRRPPGEGAADDDDRDGEGRYDEIVE